MTSQGDGSPDPVDLGKHGAGTPPEGELDFDPYRFGLPDEPVPPEFAPPGYRPPQPTQPESPYPPYGPGSPYGPNSPYGPGPVGGYGPGGPYGTPPPNAPQPGQYGTPPYGTPPYASGGPPPGYGAPGGPPPGYGYPGYGPPPRQGSGKAIGALVCGILSIVLCWLAFFDFALAIPGFVLGVMVMSNKRSAGRGMALAGVICAVLGAVLAIVLTVVYVHVEHECSGVSSGQQQQCFRDKF